MNLGDICKANFLGVVDVVSEMDASDVAPSAPCGADACTAGTTVSTAAEKVN